MVKLSKLSFAVWLALPAFSAVVTVNPGDNVASIVAANPAGTTFSFTSGTYRNQSIVPKTGDIFGGQSGAVLNGSVLLTSFTQETISSVTYWVAVGPNASGQVNSTCEAGFPVCNLPEDLYIDNVPLMRVAALGNVTIGKCFFDYSASKVYFLDVPTGHVVERSTTPIAIKEGADNVTVSGLIIEKYATPGQRGAVGEQHGGANWIVQGNEIRLNHGEGLRVGSNSQILNNNVHDNGQMGIGAFTAGTTVLIKGNEIANNNWAMFSVTNEAGGAKFGTSVLTASNNNVHDNFGNGLWCDACFPGGVYEYNTITNNARSGISHEISHDWTVRFNTITGNGFGAGQFGAGLIINESDHMDAHDNFVADNYKGIVLNMSVRSDCTINGVPFVCDLNNNSIHDNRVVERTTFFASGLFQSVGDDIYYTGKNNSFTNNSYCLGTGNQYFWWMDGFQTATAWRGFGQDAAGMFGCVGTPVLLDLTDRSTVTRTGNVILAGIPLAETAAIEDVRLLSITTAPAGACSGGANVDSHRLVTERWHGDPTDTTKYIKFILVAANAPTLAGSGIAHLCLSDRSGADPGTATTVTVNSSDTCADATTCTTVSTGINKYWIRHDYFNLFDQVRRVSDSHDYLTHSTSGGIVAVTSAGTFSSAVVPTATPGIPGYAISTEQPSGASTANEDGANLWAQVKVSGALWNGTAPKFTYTGRLFFFGGDGSWLYRGTYIFSEDMFAVANQPTSVGLYIPTTFGASLTAKFGTVYGTPATTTSVALTNAQKVSLIQYDHGNTVSNTAPTIGATTSAAAPWYVCNDTGSPNLATAANCPGLNLGGFRIVKSTTTQAVGSQSDGWMGLDDGTNQGNVWVRDNWQTYPNQITADGDVIKVFQWPADGDTLWDGRSTGDLTSIVGYKRDMALANQTGFFQFWPWVSGAAMNMTPQSPNPGRGFFSLVDSSAGGPVVLSGYGVNYKFSSSPCAGTACNFWQACTLSGGKCVYDASKARRVFTSSAWTPINGYLMAMWNGSTTANGLNNWPNLAFFTTAGVPVDVNGTIGTPPSYSSGVSSCATSNAAAVTFTGGGGAGATGSIKTALGVPTGSVTLTSSGTGYTSLPTSGTIAGCTGTATFTGGSLNTPPPLFLGSPGIAKLGTIDPMNTSQMDSFGRSWEVAGNFTSSGSAAPGNDAARWRDTLLFTNPDYFSDTSMVLGPMHKRDPVNFPRTEALIDAYFNNLYKRALVNNLFGIYYGFELYGGNPSGLGGRQIVSIDRRRYTVAYPAQFFRTGDPRFYHLMQSVAVAAEAEIHHPPQTIGPSPYTGCSGPGQPACGIDHTGSASSNVFWDSKHYTDTNSNLVAKHDGSPRCTESWGASVWFSTYNASPSTLPGGGANVDRCPDGQQPWLDYPSTTLKLNYQLSGDPRSKDLVASLAKNAIFSASDGTNIRTLTLDEGSGIYSGGAFGRAFGGCMQVSTDAAELIGNSVVNYIDLADRCFAANIQDRSTINIWTQNPTGILYDDSAIGPASATPGPNAHSHYGSHAFAQTWCYFSCGEYMNYKGSVSIAAPSYATGHASVNIQPSMVKMGKAILGWFDTGTQSGGLYTYLYPGRVAGEAYRASPDAEFIKYIKRALDFHSVGAGDQAIASGCGEGGSTTKTGDTPGVPPTPPGTGDCASPTAVTGNPPFNLATTTNPNSISVSTPDVHVGGLMALGFPYLEFPLVGQTITAPLTAPSFALVPLVSDSNAPLQWITRKVGGPATIIFHLVARVGVASDFGNLSIVTPWSGDFTAKVFDPSGNPISGFTLQDSAGHTYTGSPTAVFKTPTQMWPASAGGGAGACLTAPAPPSINFTLDGLNNKDNRDFLVTIPAAADGDYSFTLTAQGCADPTYAPSLSPQIPIATVLSPSTGNMDLVACQQGCGAVTNFVKVETGSSVVANVGTGATQFSGDSSFRFAIVDPSGTLYRGGTTKTVTPNPGCWTIDQNGPWTSESNFILTFGGVGGVKPLVSSSCAAYYDSPLYGNQTFRPNSIASNPFFLTFLGSGAVTVIRGQVVINGQVTIK